LYPESVFVPFPDFLVVGVVIGALVDESGLLVPLPVVGVVGDASMLPDVVM